MDRSMPIRVRGRLINRCKLGNVPKLLRNSRAVKGVGHTRETLQQGAYGDNEPKMNVTVHLRSYCPLPSANLPCNRLPLSVHLALCRELEGANELWKKLALGFTLSEGGREVASFSSIVVQDICRKDSPATSLLEHLWKKEKLTLSDLLVAFGHLDIRGSIVELLRDYLDEKLVVDDADLDQIDPREQLLQTCSLIPEPIHYVAAREDVIRKIEEGFEAMEEACARATTAIKIPTVVIEADPGFGKSQIARQFGEHYFKKQVGAACPVVVFTLHAGNLQELSKSYLEFAKQLGGDQESSNTLRTICFKNSVDQLNTLIPVVGERLHARSQEHPGLQWLIVVDNLFNLSDHKEERKMLDFLPHCDNPSMKFWGTGKVLITMQLRGKFKESDMRRIIVQDSLKLSVEKATEILWEVAEDDERSEPDVVKCIAQKLDCIPLALVSAATYKNCVMKENAQYTWTKYEEDLETSVKVIKLHSSQYKQKCLPHAVYMTLKKLTENNDVVKTAFMAMSYCEYRSIPGDLVCRFLQKQLDCESGLSLKIAKLRECPFLTCVDTPTGADKDITLYHMHRVTHDILQHDVVPKWGEWLELAESFLLPLLKTCLQHDKALSALPVHSPSRVFFSAHVFSVARSASTVYQKAKEEADERRCQSECLWKEIPKAMYVAVKNCKLSPRSSSEQEDLLKECIAITASDEMHAYVSRVKHAKYLSLLCHCLGNAGKESEARESGLKALSMLKEHKAKPKLIALALQNLGWHFGSEVDLGIATIEENLHYVEDAFTEDSKEYAVSLFQLGEVLKKRDRNKGRERLEKSVDILKRKGDSIELMEAQSYYARFLLKSWSSTDYRLALELCEDNIRMAEKLIDRNTMTYILMMLNWARASSACFDPGRAITELPAHLEMVKRYHQRPVQEWGLQVVMATAHLKKGNIDEGISWLRACTKLQETLDFNVQLPDRIAISLALTVLPIVNWAVIKPVNWAIIKPVNWAVIKPVTSVFAILLNL